MIVKDNFGRIHNYARISLTDSCNFHCLYCNPSGTKRPIKNSTFRLSAKTIERIISILAFHLKFTKVRFTGGEPLLHPEFDEIIERTAFLKQRYNFTVGITTNGSMLQEKLPLLRNSGISLLNVSLDSLRPEVFSSLCGNSSLPKVLTALEDAASKPGFTLKINTVLLNKYNNHEVLDFITFADQLSCELRFIEFMPFGNNQWSEECYIPYTTVLDTIKSEFDLIKMETQSSNTISYKIKGRNNLISFIPAVSNSFCNACNRIRISSDGSLKSCLFQSNTAYSLVPLLENSQVPDEKIASLFLTLLQGKNARHVDAAELSKLIENEMLRIGG